MVTVDLGRQVICSLLIAAGIYTNDCAQYFPKPVTTTTTTTRAVTTTKATTTTARTTTTTRASTSSTTSSTAPSTTTTRSTTTSRGPTSVTTTILTPTTTRTSTVPSSLATSQSSTFVTLTRASSSTTTPARSSSTSTLTSASSSVASSASTSASTAVSTSASSTASTTAPTTVSTSSGIVSSSSPSSSISPSFSTGPSSLTTSVSSSTVASSSTSSSITLITSSSTLTAATTTSTTATTTTTTVAPVPTNANVDSTILVIAGNEIDMGAATSGLNGYGIPFQQLLVPQAGVQLPTLNSTTGGNFGGIIIVGQVSYDYGSTVGWQSALTTAQWQQMYDYQATYGVRMVQIGVYPTSDFGVSASGSGCCDAGVEQLFSFTNTTSFAQAGIKEDVGISTQNLWHYPATVTDPAHTWEVAQFAANAVYNAPSTAAVINKFDGGRQQMVFFISWATAWSPTSAFLQHAYITWMTRGLYAGYRRVHLNTQVDDVFLATSIYYPGNATYRVTPTDMTAVAAWVPQLQAKMNAGSFYVPELGHNGNGNILNAQVLSTSAYDACTPNAIATDERAGTALEFKKPLGSGANAWPNLPSSFYYSQKCLSLDPLNKWFTASANRDQFMHISHTFTHYELNNATYDDALREIQFNQAWLKQTALSAGTFTANGLIPPAITGIHNGDAIRAWVDAGLTNCVGDNSRAPLRNQDNPMYAYTTSFANDGYDGFEVIPRWPTRIYYNCDTPACTTKEWIDTSAGAGEFADLLDHEINDVMRYLFGLYHDGYMFHQANLRVTGVTPITINGVTKNLSIFQAWVESVVQEFVRLVEWPMVTLSQSDLAKSFAARAKRDACKYKMTWKTKASSASTITGVTVSCDNGNSCSETVPLTVPLGTTVSDTKGFKTEQVGKDPQTIWVKLSGSPVDFTFTQPLGW